jgi:hypothetical protein
VEDQADPLRAQPEPRAKWPSGGSEILGLENAVDAISDAEKPISQRISERTI